MLFDAYIAVGSVVIHAHMQYGGFRGFYLGVENAALAIIEHKCNGHVATLKRIFLLFTNLILATALLFIADRRA